MHDAAEEKIRLSTVILVLGTESCYEVDDVLVFLGYLTYVGC